MDRLRLRGVLLVVCLLLAGCSGASPFGTETQAGTPETTEELESATTAATGITGTTTTPGDRVVVEGDGLPVDANRTFARVEQLVETSGTPPTVRVSKINRQSASDHYRSGEFSELMRVNETFPAVEDAAGGAREGWVLLRYTDDAAPDRIERTLAHEFTHVLQPANLRSKLRNADQSKYVLSTDAKFARTSIVEGVAVYVADRYAETYLEDTRPHSSELRANWENLSVGLRAYWAPYYYGQRYVASQVEPGGRLDDIYANPPRTAEQVLHGYAPDEEPRRPLDANATAPESPWDLTTEDTKGELYVRHLLEGELSRERANEAAAGWGNDRVFTYYDGTKVGHVWVTRWDDPDEVSEFEAALDEFLDRRYGETASSWAGEEMAFRVERVSDDTVVLVAGDPAFSNDATVAVNESGVDVHAAGDGEMNAGRTDPGTLYVD